MKNFRRVNWCLASTGAWHLTRGRDLLAVRFEIAKVPGTGRGGEICQHFDSGIAKVPGTWDGSDGSEAQEGGSPGQAGAEAAQKCQLALL